MKIWKCYRHGCEVCMNLFGEFRITAAGKRGVYFGAYEIVCGDCEVDDSPAPQFRDDDK